MAMFGLSHVSVWACGPRNLMKITPSRRQNRTGSERHRFRTKRQLWAYSGFALETHDSGEYRMVRGNVRRNRERLTVMGLNDNHNHDLKKRPKAIHGRATYA